MSLKHPIHFILFFTALIGAYHFFFSKKDITVKTLQLSSFADKLEELRATEHETINRLTDQQLLRELEKTKSKWSQSGKDEFAVSPEQIEKIDNRQKKQLPKRFRDNPAFQVFEQLNYLLGQKAQTQTEDP